MAYYLNPTSDIIFKKLFGQDENVDLTISFLNEVLGNKPGKLITQVTFLDTANMGNGFDQKTTYVDLLCVDEKKNSYIVEMQVAKEKSFFKRAQYYWSKGVESQLKPGEFYEDLKPVYFIAILDFTFFEYDNYLNRYVLKHESFNSVHQDTLGNYTFIELSKFKRELSDITNVVDTWVYFFKYARNQQVGEVEIPAQFTSLAKAYKKLSVLSLSPEEKRAYDKEIDIMRREHDRLQTAIEDGLEEGRKLGFQEGVQQGIEQGKQEGHLEVAQKLLASGMSLQEVANFTGLTVEQLKKIQ